MLKINLFGKELECQKAKYQDNNRLAVILVDPKTKELYTFITVNLPDALLFGELVDIENNYEAMKHLLIINLVKSINNLFKN